MRFTSFSIEHTACMCPGCLFLNVSDSSELQWHGWNVLYILTNTSKIIRWKQSGIFLIRIVYIVVIRDLDEQKCVLFKVFFSFIIIIIRRSSLAKKKNWLLLSGNNSDVDALFLTDGTKVKVSAYITSYDCSLSSNRVHAWFWAHISHVIPNMRWMKTKVSISYDLLNLLYLKEFYNCLCSGATNVQAHHTIETIMTILAQSFKKLWHTIFDCFVNFSQ